VRNNREIKAYTLLMTRLLDRVNNWSGLITMIYTHTWDKVDKTYPPPHPLFGTKKTQMEWSMAKWGLFAMPVLENITHAKDVTLNSLKPKGNIHYSLLKS
jgi:hypothetical protein